MKKVRDWIVALILGTAIIGLLMFAGAYLLIAAKHKTFFNPWG